MKRVTGAMCAFLVALGVYGTPAEAANVTVTLPTFPVTLNGMTMEQSNSQYPMLVYKDITYVPMTWADTRLLGLESSWTQSGGLVINKAAVVPDQKTAQSQYKTYRAESKNAASYPAVTASGRITVNNKSIDNSKETYPLLLFRDVTYFPLTWRFAVTEFGWDYTFDQKKGLVITPKATDSSVQTSSAIVGQKVTVSSNGVNLRSGAGTDTTVVTQLSKGTELLVLATKTVSDKLWYQVVDVQGTHSGWIASWYTTASSGTTTNNNTTNNSTTNNSTTNNSSSTTTSSSSTTGTTGSTTTSMVGKTVVVTGSSVNLRANATTASAVVGQTIKGDTYTVLAQKTVSGEVWYQVTAETGAKAWIAGWLVAQDNAGTSQSTGGTVSNVNDLIGKGIKVTADNVNLRREPGTSGASAGTVSSGTTFTILGVRTVDGQNWYQVKDSTGSNVWIASWLTTVVDTVQAKPVQLTLESIQSQSGKTVVTLKHGKGNGYAVTGATDTQLVLQLSNNYLASGSSLSQSASGGLQRLQVQQAGTNTLKATLTLQKGAYCTVKESGDNLVITVYQQTAGLAGKTIVLDPGHGGSDPGAVGRLLGVTDAQVGFAVCQKLKPLLEQAGANVIMTRTSDVRVDLATRSDLSNKNEADIFVSVHANSSTNVLPSGIQVYYYAPSGNANLYAQSYVRKQLATRVSDAMAAVTGTKSEVRTSNYAVLRENNHPSILVETGFLSNAAEEALLGTDAYRQKLAEGIYQGIVQYLNF